MNMVAQLLLFPYQFLAVTGVLVSVPIALWFLLRGMHLLNHTD